MKKFLKIFCLFLLVGFVGIQFVPTARNQQDYIPTTDFTKVYVVPATIGKLLQNSCYNCHSNNTEYPWYHKVQPAAWYLDQHVADGKEELNLSEWGSYSSRRQRSKLRSMSSQIEDGEMPLDSYTLLHPSAKLSATERKQLISWLDSLAY